MRRLQFNAHLTRPLVGPAQDALVEAARLPGNPHSAHAAGQAARRIVQQAERAVCAWVHASARTAYLLADAIEGRLLAVHQVKLGTGDGPLLDVGAADGARARQPGMGDALVHLPPASHPAAVPAGVATPRLLLLEAACVASGYLAPLQAWADYARHHQVPWLLDIHAAAPVWQALPGHTVRPSGWLLPAGPLGGPAPASALVMGAWPSLQPLWHGGGQQDGVRPGTVAKEMAAGLGAAASAAASALNAWLGLRVLRDRLDAWGETLGLRPCAPAMDRLPHITLWHGPLAEPLHARLRAARIMTTLSHCRCGVLGLRWALGPEHESADIERVFEAAAGLCK